MTTAVSPPIHLMPLKDNIIGSFFISLPRIQNYLYLKSENEHETPKTVDNCTFDGSRLQPASAAQRDAAREELEVQ